MSDAANDDGGRNPDSGPASDQAGEQRRRTGRPCRLITEPGLADRYFAAFALVRSIGVAARSIGIHRASVFRALERGRQEESGPYRDFCDRHARAKEEKIVALAQLVERASVKDPRMACWLLERLAPRQFGRQALEVRVPDPIRVQADAWLDATVAKAKTVDEVYAAADSVEKMDAVVRMDTKRRAQIRKALERSGNGADVRDDDEGAES